MSSNKQPGLPTEVSYNEAVEASKKYFDGDDLAATVWVSKYALKDSYGTLLVKISNHRKHPHFQLFILSFFYQRRHSLNFIHISTDSNFVLIS